jgi:4-hydroxybenzoate polyprenyltransferase
MYVEAEDIERTKHRPLARGDLNLRQAVVFLGAELTVGLGILLQLNSYRYEKLSVSFSLPYRSFQ